MTGVLTAVAVVVALVILLVIVWCCRCDHAHARREFRAADGSPLAPGTRQRQVLHYVCECGHVTPVIKRTPQDAAQARRLSRQRQPKARVVDIRNRRSS